MLLDCGKLLKTVNQASISADLVSAIHQATRDTDLKGWYKEGSIIGVIFTEVDGLEEKAIVRLLSNKLTDALFSTLAVRHVNEIQFSFHVFPDDWDDDGSGQPVTSSLQVTMEHELNRRKLLLHVKRAIDVLGSLVALVLCLPVFLVIALAIRLTSRGPVFFRQVRLGQYGQRFTFLKFRSMYVNNDHKIHQEYVQQFILGAKGAEQTTKGQQKIFKLTSDPRITRVGRFLRNTSLDEIPQFINVLTGKMSLVGPRPPLPYEFEKYDLWHKHRLLGVKPGITGPWQVGGRSRVTFDEMVRLDIRYARTWSLWLDIKIILQTPKAMVLGSGAC